MIDRRDAKPRIRTPAEVALDKQAEAWAKGRGVAIPSDDAGRAFGGHVETRAHKAATTESDPDRPGAATRDRLLEHRGWIRTRLSAIRTTRAVLIDEARVLEADAALLDMRLVELLGVKQIGARLRKSHPWVVGKLARIEAQIASREGERLIAAVECCWCGRSIYRAGCPGKPPKYCQKAVRNCKQIAASARRRIVQERLKNCDDIAPIPPEAAGQSGNMQISAGLGVLVPYRQGHN